MFAASCFALLAVSIASAFAQSESGPVTEPRNAQHDSASVAKGAKAITEEHDKCAVRLIVNADALFAPHRWTLNHDAAQTLDVLGPMITKAGSHPTSIEGNTSSSDSDVENRDVSQRRSITVRTWLVNHHFVAAGSTVAVGSGDTSPASQASAAPKISNLNSGAAGQKNGQVAVVVDTCH